MKTVCYVIMFLMLCINPSANAETYFFAGTSFPSLLEKTADGNFRGLATDIARTITERLGHTIVIDLYPWKRAQLMVKTGKADVLMPPYKTPEREKWLDFSELPILLDKTFFFVRPGSSFDWKGDYSLLRGQRVGIVFGWSFGPNFERAKDFVSIDYAPGIDLCFKKLLANRVDMVPTQRREAFASFKRLGLTDGQKPIAIFPELSVNFNYFGFSKQRRKALSVFKKEFDRIMIQMKENGELSRLLKKYGLSDFYAAEGKKTDVRNNAVK